MYMNQQTINYRFDEASENFNRALKCAKTVLSANFDVLKILFLFIIF